MSSSLLIWVAAAVLLFWAVGAYNRLVRQRSEANTAFAAMATEFTRQVQLVQSCLPQEDAPSINSPALEDDDAAFWGSLRGAASQFAASLAAAANRPLDPNQIAALGAARDVLTMAWERAERDDAHDLAGSRLPNTASTTRAQLVTQSDVAAEQFNLAVLRYNTSISQFPALLLAWLFGFKAGGLLSVGA